MTKKEQLEEIENFLRRYEGKITGAELQPALELIEKMFTGMHPELDEETKKSLHNFFEKMAFNEAGRSKYPALAYLTHALELKELGAEKLVADLLAWVKELSLEVTKIKWENHEIIMSALNRVKNSATDALNLYNPKLCDIYEYEITAGRIPASEKNKLVAYIKETKAKK